ncbi:hypothetical protein ACLEDY_09275 [Lonsdalea quercina]|uniref:hypothetical protein n=1 Tax=Lonsdalea quercina TaxID=71657 RepID=UPI0039750D59
MQASSLNDKAALKQSQKEIKQLKRELARKEKTLAEAAVMLVQRNQLRDYYGVTDERSAPCFSNALLKEFKVY